MNVGNVKKEKLTTLVTIDDVFRAFTLQTPIGSSVTGRNILTSQPGSTPGGVECRACGVVVLYYAVSCRVVSCCVVLCCVLCCVAVVLCCGCVVLCCVVLCFG